MKVAIGDQRSDLQIDGARATQHTIGDIGRVRAVDHPDPPSPFVTSHSRRSPATRSPQISRPKLISGCSMTVGAGEARVVVEAWRATSIRIRLSIRNIHGYSLADRYLITRRCRLQMMF